MYGRGEEIRTPDPLLPKQMRYQAALHPVTVVLTTQSIYNKKILVSMIFCLEFEKFLTEYALKFAFQTKQFNLRAAPSFILLSGGNMNLDFKIVGNDICIKLSGEIDEYSARSLRADIDKLIEAQGFRTMTFDMKNVTFIDSTGLGLLLGRYKKLRAKHAELLLKNVPMQVDKVFRTSGIYTFVPIVE